MPTYEYACQSCGTHVEVFQRFSDEPLTECGVCGGPLRKVFHPAGILFKGSGFYVTDSRSGGSKASTRTGDASKSDSASSTSSSASPPSGGGDGSKSSADSSSSTGSSKASGSAGTAKEKSA
jgi:putative FmdB family regulatory protein